MKKFDRINVAGVTVHRPGNRYSAVFGLAVELQNNPDVTQLVFGPESPVITEAVGWVALSRMQARSFPGEIISMLANYIHSIIPRCQAYCRNITRRAFEELVILIAEINRPLHETRTGFVFS